MRLEHPVEVARPGKEALEPVEHRRPCCRAPRLKEQGSCGNTKKARWLSTNRASSAPRAGLSRETVTSAFRRRLSGAASSPPAGRDSTVRFALGEMLMTGSDTSRFE